MQHAAILLGAFVLASVISVLLNILSYRSVEVDSVLRVMLGIVLPMVAARLRSRRIHVATLATLIVYYLVARLFHLTPNILLFRF